MKILELVQGTPEWDAYRAKTFNASEAAAMLGYSKHMTRSELLREKALASTADVGTFKQRLFDKGHEVEEAARHVVEGIIGDDLYPAIGEAHIEGLRLLASFDGLTMDESVCWECKLWNADLEAAIQSGDLPETHWPQLEHQLLVGGLDRGYFTIADGAENVRGMWYESVPARRAAVIAGWKQFAEDLANYSHTEDAPAPAANAIEMLPNLFVQVEGRVVDSNLAAFRETAEKFIDSIKTDLQTDQDFADADKMVKFCEEAEKKLEVVKGQALAQTASIDELFRTIDSIKDGLRKKRLDLTKSVSSRKDAIRAEIMQGGKDALAEHVDGLNKRLGKPYMPSITGDFAGVMKNKRTLSSLRDAVDTELARKKIEANAIADQIEINLKFLQANAADHEFLFADVAQLVLKDCDHFELAVKQRIADHQQQEEQKRQREAEAASATQKVLQDAKAIPVADPPPAPAELFGSAGVSSHTHAEMVTISKSEYAQLLRDADMLQCLRNAGVDNWDWYGDAVEEFQKMYGEEE